MNLNFFRSSLGKKYVMAVSGFALLMFVIGHMAGNLQFFLGPDQINAYGNFLQTTPELFLVGQVGFVGYGRVAPLRGVRALGGE